MPFPVEPVYFPPREQRGVYAAGGALFLVDPARVAEIAGEGAAGSDLVRTLTRKTYTHALYREGAIVPALGLEQGFYTVSVRSTHTKDAPMPLEHRVFSAGFTLGTETGDLLLGNTDRLRSWTPGHAPRGLEEHPPAHFERAIQVSPGWYQVTAVAGVAASDGDEEAWVCGFLLDPQPSQPAFRADLGILLTL